MSRRRARPEDAIQRAMQHVRVRRRFVWSCTFFSRYWTRYVMHIRYV
jgi:hypothetical protein